MSYDDLCAGKLNVLSDNEAVNTDTGALQCNGGAAIKKNLQVGKEIMATKIVSQTSIHVGEDLYVCGTIHANKLFNTVDDSLIFNYNLEPNINDKNVRKCLGSKNKKWDIIYGKD